MEATGVGNDSRSERHDGRLGGRLGAAAVPIRDWKD
jgi:hypothetical protein